MLFKPLCVRFILIVGMHPRVLVDGFEIAKKATLQFLEKFKTPVVMGEEPDKEILKMVARTTLRTKVLSFLCCFIFGFSFSYEIFKCMVLFVLQLYEALADQLTDIVVNAVSL